MKIIYHCYGGSHSSVTAAAIHLGWLPNDRLPTQKMLLGLPYFDRQEQKDHGTIRFLGHDEESREVYILGRRNTTKFLERTLQGVASVCGVPEEELLFVDVMPYVNWRMMVGGFTSRRLGYIPLGRPVVLRGTQLSFFRIAGMVQSVKNRIKGRS